jgi:hypothetical protein
MAYEETRAAIDLLLDEVARHPEDQRIVYDQLRDRLATLRSSGLSVPDDLARLEQLLAGEDDDESIDLFDNLPV